MDLSKYRQLFLDESREHLHVLNRELLRIEQEGLREEGIGELFRAAHSVKGMAGSMSYGPVVEVAHALEDILDRLRHRQLAVTPPLMAVLYEGVDTLGALIAEIEEGGAPRLAIENIVARLRAAAEAPSAAPPRQPAETAEAAAAPPAAEPAEFGGGLEDAEAAEVAESAPAPGEGASFPSVAAETEPAPPAPTAPAQAPLAGLAAEAKSGDLVAARGGIYTLEPEKLAMVRDFVRSGLVPYACQLRVVRDTAALGARNFIILGRLSKIGMVLASSPTLEEVRAGNSRDLVEALLLTDRPEEQLRAQLLAIPELQELRLRRLQIGSGEPAVPGGAPAAEAETLLAPLQASVERPAGVATGLADRYAARKAATVRVDTRVLDDLINIVGELLITRERLHEIGRDLESEELHLHLERLRVLVRGFQDTIMTVRMMPLELVTDRLPRMVRDFAHQAGKLVSFEVAGKGIELDRAILEELNDVLIHVVRNAVDHGVETPEQRAAAGKAPRAAIRVRAGRERDWVWIRVEDDGRGMDAERIAQAAVARGLIGAEKAAALDAREKLLLCCLPGVSTADKVTDVSGRGVGMDVVKARIDAFGGALQIDSRPGRGTAITLRLPLTLAIIRILLVEVRGQEYGLPVSHVVRTAQLEPAQVEWSRRKPLLHHDGRLVPLHDLGGLLGLPARDLRAQPGLFLAVVEFGERAAGLAVDRLLGTYEVVIKPLGPPLKRVRGLAGVTVLGDGRTVLLLDLAALV